MKQRYQTTFRFPPINSKKRGQLTIFIIIGVVIVLLIAFYSIFKSILFNNIIYGSDIVLDDILDCLESSTEQSLYIVTYQGGYSNPPEKHFSFSPTFFPYYYYENESFMPSLENIEKEMGKEVKKRLAKCLPNINKHNFDVSYSASSVDVDITRDGVEFIIDMPIVLQKNNISMRIELLEYPQFYENKLYSLYEVSKFFVEDQLEDPEYYCITCITEICENEGLKFYLFNILPDIYLVMAFEDNNNPLVFNFVNKYKNETIES